MTTETPKRPRPKRTHTKHDEELMASKNRSRRQRVALACDTYYTDEEGVFFGTVEFVDQYAIKFRIDSNTSGVWVMKQAIVSTHEVG